MLHTTNKTLPWRLAAAFLAIGCGLSASAQTAPAEAQAQGTAAQQPAPAADAAAAPASDPQAAAAGLPASIPLTTTIPLTAEAAAVKKRLEGKFPQAAIKNVSKSGILGLFEAQFDGQMVYTDSNASYVLVGQIYDADSKKNLTEERSRKLNRIAWDALPLDLAMKKVKGTGQRKLVVFSDADCPFCARLERELKNVDDVTIYTFLFPIDSLHPDSARKSKVIWCSPDRLKAWDDFFASGKLPENSGDCETPLPKTLALGHALHVNATPTLVFADGSMIPGALPKDRLEAEMTQADVEAKKLAAAKK